METGLTFSSLAALAGIMALGALIPGASALTVAARSAAHGFRHGLYTTLGIVAGDLVFILIALYGLAFLSRLTGEYFPLFQYLGGGYLIGLGILLWISRPGTHAIQTEVESSPWASFLAGLLITLGDQKAVLFYLGILPALVNVASPTPAETAAVLATAVVAVGAPKLFYAWLAKRTATFFNRARALRTLNRIAGVLLATAGAFLIARAW